jgi:hypothetical protein
MHLIKKNPKRKEVKTMKRIIFSVCALSMWLLSANAFAQAVPTHQVPEPSTFLLLGAGIAGVGLLRRIFKS